MFAGIGGFRTGLTNAGDFFMPVGWCEKDKHAQKAYRLLYGTEGEYFCDDARIINPADMPDFDLICGGFPCQPFSVAGQRLGFADERGTLFHEICRLAEARHPKYLLLENVSGLLTHEGGQTFLAILTALEQLGYSLEWCVVNSANFGVPQDRKRVYIVGYLDSRLSGKIYPVRESTYSNLKQLIPGRQGQRVYSPDGAAVCLMSQGGGQGAKTGLYLIDMNENPKLTPLARCITARQDSGISNRKGEHSGVLITGARAILTPERLKVRQCGRRFKGPDEPMYALTTQDVHGVKSIKNDIIREAMRMSQSGEQKRESRTDNDTTSHHGSEKKTAPHHRVNTVRATAVTGLLKNLANTFRDKILGDDAKKLPTIDKRQRREIEEKKNAEIGYTM